MTQTVLLLLNITPNMVQIVLLLLKQMINVIPVSKPMTNILYFLLFPNQWDQ